MPESTEVTGQTARSRPADILYENLKNNIIDLSLKPGEMLSEHSLAYQADVSRVVVRSALSHLAEEGYVKVSPQRGTFVALIDQSRVRQAVRAHVILEQAVIDDLCKNGMTDEERDSLKSFMAAMLLITDESDIPFLIDKERELHWLILKIDKKDYLYDFFRVLDGDMRRVRYLQYSTFNYKVNMSSLTTWEYAKTEGKLLVDNILRHETSTASILCADHFNSIILNMVTLREIYPQFFTG